MDYFITYILTVQYILKFQNDRYIMALRWFQEFLWKNHVIPKVTFMSFN